MPGPLSGYRIVDLTSMISGPYATMILGDQGADVIKVENPDGGDHTRAANNSRNGFSASFLNNNRNKRSVALDLKQPAARDALLRLAATADVFVQNFRPWGSARQRSVPCRRGSSTSRSADLERRGHMPKSPSTIL
jgi:crotonobetainyl-CoA:carnitine CoA-transferase CaiB-like acyl-CoA transferase